MKRALIDILVILPISRDRKALQELDDKYNYHFLEDLSFQPLQESADFDILAYVNRAKSYLKKHGIENVLYTHDVGSLIAGALHEESGVIAPSVESMFLCLHKFYSRKKEISPIKSSWIDLKKSENFEITFPCYLKPALLAGSFYQYKIENENDLKNALKYAKSSIPKVSKMFYDFFSKYIDQAKYPLSNKNMMLVEEIVIGSQHCVEGFVDNEDKIYIWAVSDQNYFPKHPLVIDHFTAPTHLNSEKQKKVIDLAVETVKRHGIKNGFWNVEIWIQKDQCFVTEINGRSAATWHKLYEGVFGKSLYLAMSDLACGKKVKIFDQKQKVGGQFILTTFGEGKAYEFLDYREAIKLSNIKVFFPEDYEILQVKRKGFPLARIDLFGNNYEEICVEANQIRKKLIKKPEISPHI